MLMVSYPSVE